MIFNEILAMAAFVKNLAPLLADDLGVLLDDEGNATAQPAMYLADNFAPKSTLPRLVLSYQGSQNGHTINRYAYQEQGELITLAGEEFMQSGEDQAESGNGSITKYFIRRENHIEWAMTITAESGSITEVMTNGRMSANGLLRKVRTLLARESVRKAINDDAECGVNFIGNEVASRTLDGVTRTDVSSLLLSNLTYLQKDDEEVVGVVDSVSISGTLSKVDGTDPDPLGVSSGVTS
jgi:hypothetical protein